MKEEGGRWVFAISQHGAAQTFETGDQPLPVLPNNLESENGASVRFCWKSLRFRIHFPQTGVDTLKIPECHQERRADKSVAGTPQPRTGPDAGGPVCTGGFHRSLLWLQPSQPPVALETTVLCELNKRVCLAAAD